MKKLIFMEWIDKSLGVNEIWPLLQAPEESWLLILHDMDEHFCEASKILPDPHINNVVVVVEDIPYFFSLMYYEMTRKKLWHDVYVMEWSFVLYSPKTKSYPLHSI